MYGKGIAFRLRPKILKKTNQKYLSWNLLFMEDVDWLAYPRSFREMDWLGGISVTIRYNKSLFHKELWLWRRILNVPYTSLGNYVLKYPKIRTIHWSRASLWPQSTLLALEVADLIIKYWCFARAFVFQKELFSSHVSQLVMDRVSEIGVLWRFHEFFKK